MPLDHKNLIILFLLIFQPRQRKSADPRKIKKSAVPILPPNPVWPFAIPGNSLAFAAAAAAAAAAAGQHQADLDIKVEQIKVEYDSDE